MIGALHGFSSTFRTIIHGVLRRSGLFLRNSLPRERQVLFCILRHIIWSGIIHRFWCSLMISRFRCYLMQPESSFLPQRWWSRLSIWRRSCADIGSRFTGFCVSAIRYCQPMKCCRRSVRYWLTETLPLRKPLHGMKRALERNSVSPVCMSTIWCHWSSRMMWSFRKWYWCILPLTAVWMVYIIRSCMPMSIGIRLFIRNFMKATGSIWNGLWSSRF